MSEKVHPELKKVIDLLTFWFWKKQFEQINTEMINKRSWYLKR